MASTRDIRRRIKSIRNTSQITKAMQMVAASKMRKAQQAALSGRPYCTLLNKVLGEVATHAGDFHHPLLKVREVRKRGVILVSSDKGLCGGLNSNLLREAARLDKDQTYFITAGRKGSQFVARTKRNLLAEFNYKDAPQFAEARTIAKFAQEIFLEGEVDQVDILFTRFYSTLNQKPQLFPFLPVTEDGSVCGNTETPVPETAEELLDGGSEFLFEPSAEAVLGAMLPYALNYRIYQILLEAKASEHSARMVAMKNATDNAENLIKDLTLEYNKMRQAAITKELLEISSAAMALG